MWRQSLLISACLLAMSQARADVDYSIGTLLDEPASASSENQLGTEVSFRVAAPRHFADRDSFSWLAANRYSLYADARSLGGSEDLYELPRPDTGLSYRAALRVVDEAGSDGFPVIRGSSLGLSYGTYSRDWFHGVDVNLADEEATDLRDRYPLWSLGYTAGRHFEWPWRGSSAPMWLLSLRGDFADEKLSSRDSQPSQLGDWYLTPSLFWEAPEFTLSAGIELPMVESDQFVDEPDYRLRATFQRRF
jgi:hypothetical protein